MKAIAQALKSLLKHTKHVAKRVPATAVASFVRQDLNLFCKNVARKFRITLRDPKTLQEIEYSFEKLSKEDKEIVEDMIDYSTRLVQNYLDNHDKYADERKREEDIEALLLSHASELYEAGKKAYISQYGSRLYNSAFGKPDTSKTLFTDENILKTAAISVIKDTLAELDAAADKVERQRRTS